MKGRSSRMRKVDELLREVVAEEVALLKDPRIGFVTVTGVDTAPDLRRATVFYSAMGTEEELRDTAAGLEHAAPHVQTRVGG
ncbi:MAG: ribosome-binding factor A, partial [Actinomycetota bacterium]|nr:ribosome-binding factor A [Actinomycetota bacterium]